MDGCCHISPSIPPSSERRNKLYDMVVQLFQNQSQNAPDTSSLKLVKTEI